MKPTIATKHGRRTQQWRCRVIVAGALASGMVTSGMWAQGTSAPVKDDLFAGTEKFAAGASDVTEVTMDPDTLGMVNGKGSQRAHAMVLNVVRTYEYDKPGMYRIEDVEEIRKRLDTGDWHCSIHTRDLKHGESTDICNKRRTDGLVEQAIITVEPKELTFIHTIRRQGSGGSSLSLPDVGDVMGEVGPELALLGPTMAAVRPEMEAEIKASMAEMRTHSAEMTQGMEVLKEQMPQLNVPELQEQMRRVPKISPEINPKLSPEQSKGLEKGTHEPDKEAPRP